MFGLVKFIFNNINMLNIFFKILNFFIKLLTLSLFYEIL